jgi:hypothetical protein
VVEEGVRRVLDGQRRRVGSGLFAGVQVVLFRQVLRQRGVRVGPRPEVVQLAANLLGLDAGRVGEEGEIGIGLGGLGERARIVGKHGDTP